MNEQENLALEINAENVEETTEETQVEQVKAPEEKVYTESEFKAKLEEAVDKRVARREAKIHKQYERKYGELEGVLKAGTGKADVAEITDSFRNYYQNQGVQMPAQPSYSDRDIEVLAKAEANDIIGAGYDEVVEEVDRLAKLGTKNMSPREKAVFRALAEYRQNADRGRELAKIGVTEDVYNSAEFRTFASKFNSSTPITEIYSMYHKMQPKKEVRPMGSMTDSQAPKVKDFYTPEEIGRLTEEDLDNEEVWNAVRKSMTGRA